MKINHTITYPSSKKIYIKGKIHDIRVGMRRITLLDTISEEGGTLKNEKNKPIVVYDTSGAYSDAGVDITRGLHRLREEWIEQRADTEKLPAFSSEYCNRRLDDKSLDAVRFPVINLPRRAKVGQCISQMYYAQQGVITPEMEYVAIRENQQNEELGIATHITPEFVRDEIAADRKSVV